MHSVGLVQVYRAVRLQVYSDEQLQVHCALQLQVFWGGERRFAGFPSQIRLQKKDGETSGANCLQICLCQSSQEGALGCMCLAKLLHRQLEPGFVPLANSQVMQIN